MKIIDDNYLICHFYYHFSVSFLYFYQAIHNHLEEV